MKTRIDYHNIEKPVHGGPEVPERRSGTMCIEDGGIMATRQLHKAEWQSYFDRVSKALTGKQAEIEIASLTLGSQIEAEWSPLHGITYDPKSDVVEVLLEGLDHLIHRPQAVYVDFGTNGLQSLAVIDSDDNKQIVKLRDPLMMPPSA